MNALGRIFRPPALLLGCTLWAACLGGCAHLKPQPFTFVQMCDPQLGFGGYEEDLARLDVAVQKINALQPDFVVICGDLVNTPNERSFQAFNTARSRLSMPSFCAPGNHDVGNAPTPQTLQTYHRFMGRDYFSFIHKGCVFVVLNTQVWKAPLASVTGQQEAWLLKTLKAAARKAQPVFIVEHYPPFVDTADEPDGYFNLPLTTRKPLLNEFARYGVVAVLAGHTHKATANWCGQIQIVTAETTSNNFDKRPYGFRLWHVSPGGTCWHEFVPVWGPK